MCIRDSLIGCMHGAHAALRQFKSQKSGVLINLNSIGAWLPMPYSASYNASKFGLRAFMDTLRAEVRDEKSIRICDVHPSFVDTPGFEHGGNYLGVRLRPAPPIYSPEKVARHVVQLASRPEDKAMIGWPVPVGRAMYALFPKVTLRMMKSLLDLSRRMGSPVPPTDGTIHQPRREPSRSSGGWKSDSPSPLLGLAAMALGFYLAARKKGPGAVLSSGVMADRQARRA